MIDICLERGEYNVEQFLRNRGINDRVIDKVVYKDKINYVLIWSCMVFFLVVMILVIYKL